MQIDFVISMYPFIYILYKFIILYGILTFAINIIIGILSGKNWVDWSRKKKGSFIAFASVLSLIFLFCIFVGRDLVEMPNFINKSYETSIEITGSYRLENVVYREYRDPKNIIEQDIITWQSIDPGTIINRFDTIELVTTYDRAKMILLPNFIGITINEARILADNLGLIIEINGNAEPEYTVSLQTPTYSPGVYVPSGSNVRLNVKPYMTSPPEGGSGIKSPPEGGRPPSPPIHYRLGVVYTEYNNVIIAPSKWEAIAGESVTVEITALEGYELTDVWIKTESGYMVSYTISNGLFTFTMPNENVDIYLTVIGIIIQEPPPLAPEPSFYSINVEFLGTHLDDFSVRIISETNNYAGDRPCYRAGEQINIALKFIDGYELLKPYVSTESGKSVSLSYVGYEDGSYFWNIIMPSENITVFVNCPLATQENDT